MERAPIQQKDRLLYKAILLILSLKQPSLLLNEEVVWQASDYSFSKELHDQVLPKLKTISSLNQCFTASA